MSITSIFSDELKDPGIIPEYSWYRALSGDRYSSVYLHNPQVNNCQMAIFSFKQSYLLSMEI